MLSKAVINTVQFYDDEQLARIVISKQVQEKSARIQGKNRTEMLTLLKKKIYPIGIDLGSGYLRMSQLGFNGESLYLYAGGCEIKPESIIAGSPEWQRWSVDTIKDLMRKCSFKGKSVITSLPSDDLFIDQIRIPKTPPKRIRDVIFAKVEKKLPFKGEATTIQHVVLKDDSEMDIMVMATEQNKIKHHLAIFEAAGLEIQSIQTWPETMISSYVNFFSRRREDESKIALLMDIGTNHTNVIICQHSQLLFARLISIGFNQLRQGEMVQRLIAEIDACCHYFDSVSSGKRIQLLMFLANRNIDKDICMKVAELAQRLQIQAQMGDVMSAVEKRSGCDETLDRRDNYINWATSFGLSLTGRNANNPQEAS
jgi:Tfp pilus assembly PilM family ATPase